MCAWSSFAEKKTRLGPLLKVRRPDPVNPTWPNELKLARSGPGGADFEFSSNHFTVRTSTVVLHILYWARGGREGDRPNALFLDPPLFLHRIEHLLLNSR